MQANLININIGAQGEEIPYSICSDCRNVRQGYREFKNFELGILFRSTKTRQYLALNNACPVCTRAKPFQKITATRENDRKPNDNESRYSSFGIVPKRYSPIQNITLPLPFNLSNAKPYCNSQGKLVIDPYFHEDLQVSSQRIICFFLYLIFLHCITVEKSIGRIQIGCQFCSNSKKASSIFPSESIYNS